MDDFEVVERVIPEMKDTELHRKIHEFVISEMERQLQALEAQTLDFLRNGDVPEVYHCNVCGLSKVVLAGTSPATWHECPGRRRFFLPEA